MTTLSIGWAGVGNMGTPMAMNLLKAGFPVTVYNRTPERAAALTSAGAKLVHTPAELAGASDIVITMVSDDEAVMQLFTGDQGILTGITPGKMAINMSTIAPGTTHEVARQCTDKGVDFLDAPVSGSVKPAEDGALVILAGGPAELVNKAKSIFDRLGKKTVHCGDTGAGSSAKLAINLLVGLNFQGLAETVLFAKNNGIQVEDMLDIINESACGNGVTRSKTPGILSGTYPVAFAIKHYAKDLRLAKSEGLTTPLVNTLHNSYQDALAAGYENEDVMAILKFLEK